MDILGWVWRGGIAFRGTHQDGSLEGRGPSLLLGGSFPASDVGAETGRNPREASHQTEPAMRRAHSRGAPWVISLQATCLGLPSLSPSCSHSRAQAGSFHLGLRSKGATGSAADAYTAPLAAWPLPQSSVLGPRRLGQVHSRVHACVRACVCVCVCVCPGSAVSCFPLRPGLPGMERVGASRPLLPPQPEVSPKEFGGWEDSCSPLCHGQQ